MTDLVTTQQQSTAIERTVESEALIREQFGLQQATSMEIEYLFAVANRTGLDPVTKQIYGIMRYDKRARREKLTVQIGIDGARLIAARTGEYAGSDDAVFAGTVDGTVYPEQATVTVYRIVQGTRCPFTATARWREYVQTNREGAPSGQWPRMPHVMLAKCAEALALRKAFPAELGGIYTDAELQQADHSPAVATPLSPAQAEELRELGSRAGLKAAAMERRISAITAEQFDEAVAALRQRIAEQEEVEAAQVVVEPEEAAS